MCVGLFLVEVVVGVREIYFVGEVHEDGVGAGIRVLGQVYACKVLVFDEYWAVCRRQWSQRKRALDVVTG